ncbi:hypothetical protein [Brevundimonas lenta]|uniref:EthD domain-containing protein n=1 Tax=Brevundimonas lenta TaxID=424796 RepID=A0A7W6JFK6_9CAUL|nr:hypothetical protein [Brevundimonas lenta]MBB4084217.1 hypothetical protein [Brevundimonas lenta]
MRKRVIVAALMAWPLAAGAQTAAPEPRAEPVVVESYYRIRWGGMGEFMELYRRNHAPVLEAMQARGFITGIEIEQPFTHMAGDQRWDLRVTITYRDADAALGPEYGAAAEAEMDRLYTDVAGHTAEEARRFSLVEEHWDVVVEAAD